MVTSGQTEILKCLNVTRPVILEKQNKTKQNPGNASHLLPTFPNGWRKGCSSRAKFVSSRASNPVLSLPEVQGPWRAEGSALLVARPGLRPLSLGLTSPWPSLSPFLVALRIQASCVTKSNPFSLHPISSSAFIAF